MGRSVYVPSRAEVVAYVGVESDLEQDDWEYLVDELVLGLEAAFPSVGADSGWMGNEGRVIASNRYARFVIADYCGLMSVSIVPEGYDALSEAWARRVAPRFNRIVESIFGARYNRLGSMSNGEGVFERAAA